MRYKHLALLFVAGSFLLGSLPARAESEDAPLPGDFQSAPPSKSSRSSAPAAPQGRQDKSSSSNAPVLAHAKSHGQKQVHSKAGRFHARKSAIKGRHKVAKHRHLGRQASLAHKTSKHLSKAGKKSHAATRASMRGKHLKRSHSFAHGKGKSIRKGRAIHKKPLKTAKKKPLPYKRKK